MEPDKGADAEYDPFEDVELMEELMAIPSENVNHGFVPEGFAFWRRWRKTADS